MAVQTLWVHYFIPHSFRKWLDLIAVGVGAFILTLMVKCRIAMMPIPYEQLFSTMLNPSPTVLFS